MKTPAELQYHLFKTSQGWVGLAWTDRGLRRIVFPQASRALAEKAITRHHRKAIKARALPEWVHPLGERLEAELSGLAAKSRAPLPPLDISTHADSERLIYEKILRLPRGQTTTIESLASELSLPKRKVREAILTNPLPMLVPCHRVRLTEKSGDAREPGDVRAHLAAFESRPRKPQSFADRNFDIDVALAELSKNDPKLGRLIRKIGPFRLKVEKRDQPFDRLLRSIIFQQLNGKAAGTIHDRLKSLFGGRNPTFAELLEADATVLQSAGLSRQKIAALKDLARAASEGLVPDRKGMARLHDEEIIERLVSIRGVGRWTVEMLLIFGLGRTDVWPVDDFAIRKAAMILHGLKETPDRRSLKALADGWRPYRSIVSWYLWRSLD